MRPSYLALHASGELAARAEEALSRLACCDLCPRQCRVDRLSGETGFCRTGRQAVIASYQLHFGEEAVLVGAGGSGTMFFSGCNLGCVFCQNRDISHGDPPGDPPGPTAEPEELAGVMLELQRQGAENINLVSPGHVAAQILEALPIAAAHGLELPLVWNSGGYDRVDTLRLFEGVVDIFMPDAKVWDPEQAQRLLLARDYPEAARAALAEMHRQVGDLIIGERGTAGRGLLVRHLVLPGGAAGTREWMSFVAGLSRATWVNVTDQYRPCGRAHEFSGLERPITPRERDEALEAARSAGLNRLDTGADRLIYRFFRSAR